MQVEKKPRWRQRGKGGTTFFLGIVYNETTISAPDTLMTDFTLTLFASTS